MWQTKLSMSVGQTCLLLFSCSVVADSVTPWMPGILVLSLGACSNTSIAIQPSQPMLSPSSPQSFPASGSFPMSRLFASGGQRIGVSASKSVLPMNTQDWSPLGWTGWISLQSKVFSSVFSNTTVQEHKFFGSQPSNSHIHTWLLEKP